MEKGVYFFLRPFHSADDAGYQHRSVCLAEGLQALGVPVYANAPYWKLGPDSTECLFPFDASVRPEDCDVVVTEHVYFEEHHRLPPQYGTSRRRYRTVFLDAADGWRTAAMPIYGAGIDLVLKCHFNSRFDYGRNVRPWAFGLSGRILKAIQEAGETGTREKLILWNFRASHSVRTEANRNFLPLLEGILRTDATIETSAPALPHDNLMWQQTGRRHYPDFYRRLTRSVACSAFGGYFVPSFARSLDSLPQRVAYKAVSTLGLKTGTVAQFDSWRFWESLAAGCATFHVDLERYGCVLPDMPGNGKHYVGVDFSRPGLLPSRIRSGDLDLERIARHGREWALESYSPEATAKRFLEYVGAIP